MFGIKKLKQMSNESRIASFIWTVTTLMAGFLIYLICTIGN